MPIQLPKKLSRIGSHAGRAPVVLTALMIAAAPVLLATSAQANDFVLGLGQSNFDDSDESQPFTVQLEYHTAPFLEYSWGDISGIGVLEVDDDNNTYVGAGVAALWNTGQKWFIEASLAAGYYGRGSDGQDLGGNVQFRSLLGLGYRVSDTRRISIAIDHLSNAGIEDTNPGRNAISIRYGVSF